MDRSVSQFRPRSDGQPPLRILVIDNYDSFVFNLVQYLAQLGADPVVRRNDEIPLEQADGFDGVLLSPGPGVPERAGICVDLVGYVAGRIPLLGVCLGHQAIAVAYGATVSRAPELLHGKTSLVHHGGAGVLNGLPDPFTATRYHSLAVEVSTIAPDVLEVTGRTASGVVMAMRHRSLDVEGVQFHPESVLTQGGHRMLANWLVRCGDPEAVLRASGLAPVAPAPPVPPGPPGPPGPARSARVAAQLTRSPAGAPTPSIRDGLPRQQPLL